MYHSGISTPHQACILLWDTDREREINLGDRYTFGKLGYGECNINEKQLEAMQAKEGDFMYMSVMAGNLINVIIKKYNTQLNSTTKPL